MFLPGVSNVNKSLFLLSVVPALLVDSPGWAIEAEIKQKTDDELSQIISNIPDLNEIQLPSTNAELLRQQSITNEISQDTPSIEEETTDPDSSDDADITIETIGEQDPLPQSTPTYIIEQEDPLPQSTPTYIIEQEEIKKQGANSVADILKRMPGFAINDAGHGADIHTGTYYRGASINQSVFLINGRRINNNVNTYHGATDLNSIPVEAIERVELYSGAASTLYGSSAFGGVVNIITKEGYGQPKFSSSVEFGSLSQNNQQVSYGGSTGSLKYNFSFERYFTDNRYRVPIGAANRDAEGFLFNADTATSTYFGNIGVDLDQPQVPILVILA